MTATATTPELDLDDLLAMRRRIGKPTGRVRPPALDDPSQYTRNSRVPLGENPGKFQPIAKVPLLDPCHVPGKYTATAEDLARIVENTNARVARGDLPIVTIGHFREKDTEETQPPLVGYLTDFVLGEYGGEPCILADEYIDVRYYDEAMTYPRRSIEMWTGTGEDDNYIDSLALLRRSPERDLGLITFSRSAGGDRTRIQFSRDSRPSTLPTADELRRTIADAVRGALSPDRKLVQLQKDSAAPGWWTPEHRSRMHDLASRRGITDVSEAKREYVRTFALGVWG